MVGGMVAIELRIGNFIYCDGILTNVKNIYNDGVDFVNERGDVNFSAFEHVKPIPLSEEILLKCGLELRCDELHINDKVFEFIGNDLYYTDGSGRKLSIPIKFLHQLQNFYFALTGTELEIEL